MSSNYFDQQVLSSVERVKLAEDIILPKLPVEPLTLEYLENMGEYKLAINEYQDTMGKFYLPIMTPLVDKAETNDKLTVAPSTRQHRGSNLRTQSYNTTNFISLVIPKYILLNFKDKVPKGTEFIIASIGSSLDIDDMRIIGIYSLITESAE